MGNFYTNVVVPGTDVARVADVLKALGRRAIIAGTRRAAFVYDAQCDDQDRAIIEQFAGALSSSCGTTLAVSNHDDDVLWYALARDGRVIDTYDSNPGYFRGERLTPTGGEAALLTNAFGVPEARERVEPLLRRSAGDGACEIDRHTELLELLGLPLEPAILGYRYVSRGELASSPGVTSLVGVGDAELPPDLRKKRGRKKSKSGAADDEIAAEVARAYDREFGERVNASCLALELAEVEFDEQFASITGTGPMNAWLAMMKVEYYASRHGLTSSDNPLLVRCDALLERLLRVSEYSRAESTVIAQRAFGVPSLTAEDLRQLRDRNSSRGRALVDLRRSLHVEYTRWILDEIARLPGQGRSSKVMDELIARVRDAHDILKGS